MADGDGLDQQDALTQAVRCCSISALAVGVDQKLVIDGGLDVIDPRASGCQVRFCRVGLLIAFPASYSVFPVVACGRS